MNPWFARVFAPLRREGRIDPAFWLILIYWIGQYGLLSVQRLMLAAANPDQPVAEVKLLIPRILSHLMGALISMGILAMLRRRRHLDWPMLLLLGVGFSLVASVVHAVGNFLIFSMYLGGVGSINATPLSYGQALLSWFSGYIALTAMLVAVVFAEEARENERRISEFRALANDAQLLALRYQLQPHFMFNTLNSIASLISAGKPDTAEQMVENLSDFLRASLAIQPLESLSLGEEIELQSLYLAIEAVRFPDRLKIEIDVPDALRELPVPSLILQPLVENAVKHGVSASLAEVTIAIRACAVQEGVRLTVSNDAPGDGGDARGGARIGIANVARRLEAHYGDGCSFSAGIVDGKFEVGFTVPRDRA